MHPPLGVWKLDETVPVVFEILLHTISTLWAEASVSLTLCRIKCSLDHFNISTQYRSWDFFLAFCHKWAVYADRANTRLRAPVVRPFVPNELPCHTRHGALHNAVQPSLQAIDCFWQTHCSEILISSIELGLAKKLHQLFLHLIFLYLSLFLPCTISVVRCCYESSFMEITRDVRFLGKRVNTKTQTFQSGNHEGVELVLLLGYSWGSIEGCCILMLKCFYTCS